MAEFITPNDHVFFAESDALTIQNAIAAAVKDGCRKLVIPRYKSNVQPPGKADLLQ